ncbi:MAG: glutamate decarboxylase [Clostridia bacterium]|nr:glutamate decarboxylase [Clostridia bacterium]
MWTVIYIAPNRKVAESVKEILVAEGILVKLRQVGESKSDKGTIEVMVPEVEAEEACEIIAKLV